MQHSMNKIRGVSFLGILLWVVIVIFGALVLIQLVPPYIDYYQVKDSLDVLAKDPSTPQMSKPRIREMFSRRLQVNNIKNVDPNKLEIENKQGKTWLTIQYETRVHVLGNVDAVLKFQTQAMVE